MSIDKKAFAALAETPRLKEVSVDGLGDVHIAELTVEEVDAIGKAAEGQPSAVLWMRHGVCDADGKRLFSDKDLPMLRKMPHRVSLKLSTEILEFNGLGVKSPEEAKNA